MESTAAATTGSSGGCAGSIDAVIDGGPVQHWQSNCEGTYGADLSADLVAYFSYPEGGPPYPFYQLVIQGCASQIAGADGVRIAIDGAMSTGTFEKGSATYADSEGISWNSNGAPLQAYVTALEPTPSGYVDGSFSTTVGSGQTTRTISGQFHACRIPDQIVP